MAPADPNFASPERIAAGVGGCTRAKTMRPACDMKPVRYPTEPSTTMSPPFIATPHRGPASPRTWIRPPRIEAPALMPAIALDRDVSARHRFARTPTRIASDRDRCAVVESAAVVAHRPVEEHVGALGKADTEVVARRAAGEPRLFSLRPRPARMSAFTSRIGTVAGRLTRPSVPVMRGPPALHRPKGGTATGSVVVDDVHLVDEDLAEGLLLGGDSQASRFLLDTARGLIAQRSLAKTTWSMVARM